MPVYEENIAPYGEALDLQDFQLFGNHHRGEREAGDKTDTETGRDGLAHAFRGGAFQRNRKVGRRNAALYERGKYIGGRDDAGSNDRHPRRDRVRYLLSKRPDFIEMPLAESLEYPALRGEREYPAASPYEFDAGRLLERGDAVAHGRLSHPERARRERKAAVFNNDQNWRSCLRSKLSFFMAVYFHPYMFHAGISIFDYRVAGSYSASLIPAERPQDQARCIYMSLSPFGDMGGRLAGDISATTQIILKRLAAIPRS